MTDEELKEIKEDARQLMMHSYDTVQMVIVPEKNFNALVSEIQHRRAVRSEDVQKHIETLKDIYPSKKEIVTGEYPDVADALDAAIQALEQYEPKPKPTSEDVQRAIDWHKERLEHFDECKCEDCLIEINIANLSILALEAYQPWISVENRLPTVYQYENGEPIEFNVMIKDAEVPTTLCFNGSEWFEWRDTDGFFEVTHWMPLPQPPKEVNNG